MDGIHKNIGRRKKKADIERPVSTALFTLHALQAGLSLKDLTSLDAGFVLDMIIEQGNDTYEWPEKAGQEDFDRFREI